MDLIITREKMPIKEYEVLNKITIDPSKPNPTINAEFFETHPFKKDEITLSHITYEKKLNEMRVSYQRPLTSKSGMELTFDITPKGIITDGFVDFYTIKRSSDKRNGFYRLEYHNGRNFELYVRTSRNNGFKYPISGCKISEDLTPRALTVIISRMIQVINKHAKRKNKQPITNKYTSFSSLNGLLNLEEYLIEKIKETIEAGNLTPTESKALQYFIEAYTDCEKEQLERIEEEQLRRVKEKKENN